MIITQKNKSDIMTIVTNMFMIHVHGSINTLIIMVSHFHIKDD